MTASTLKWAWGGNKHSVSLTSRDGDEEERAEGRREGSYFENILLFKKLTFVFLQLEHRLSLDPSKVMMMMMHVLIHLDNCGWAAGGQWLKKFRIIEKPIENWKRMGLKSQIDFCSWTMFPMNQWWGVMWSTSAFNKSPEQLIKLFITWLLCCRPSTGCPLRIPSRWWTHEGILTFSRSAALWTNPVQPSYSRDRFPSKVHVEKPELTVAWQQK